jgi:hypothetical protein
MHETIFDHVEQCFPKVLLADHFWLRKITRDLHMLGHVNSVWG